MDTFHGLWVGSRLRTLELLTIKSFLAHGHHFKLWSYEDVGVPYLQGHLELGDASTIVPRERVFRYSGGQFPGSYAGFSDVFRYELLRKLGGWWIDMDVVCLRPFDFNSPYVFRHHQIGSSLVAVGNVMKVPAQSALMEHCCNAVRTLNADNLDFLGPVRPLSEGIVALGLDRYIVGLPYFDYDMEWSWSDYFASDKEPPAKQYVLHTCATWRKSLNRSAPAPGSYMHTLLKRYDLLDTTPGYTAA